MVQKHGLLRKREEELLERTEMGMLRWILRVSRREPLRNVETSKRAGFASITGRIGERASCGGLNMWREERKNNQSRKHRMSQLEGKDQGDNRD